MVKINIEKRTLFLWATIFVVLIGLVGVYAYGGSSPSVMGHTMGEIEGWEQDSYGFYYDGTFGIGASTGPTSLKFKVDGSVGADYYCDADGTNCKTIDELMGSAETGTGYYSLGGFDFQVREGPDADYNYNLYASCLKSTSSSTLGAYAPVHIPHGATVTGVYVQGGSAGSWNMARVEITNPMSTSNMASGSGNSLDSSINYATVDNSQYLYRIYISLYPGGSICGAYVKFTYP